MSRRLHQSLSKRERQIMDAVYTRGSASAAEVRAAMPSAPSDSAVRATLRVLVHKGFLTYRSEGRRYLYAPTIPREKARRSAAEQLLRTYFGGSVEAAVATLIRVERARPSQTDYRRLLALIRKAEKEDSS